MVRTFISSQAHENEMALARILTSDAARPNAAVKRSSSRIGHPPRKRSKQFVVSVIAMLRQLPARFLISEVSAAAAFAGTGRCRLQTVLDRSKKRSRHLAREVCRVVRAAHAGVVRDLWIGTEWPCHVDTVVSDSRCDQSIGCDSGLAPTL